MKTNQAYYGIVSALPEIPRKGQEGFRMLHIPRIYTDLLNDTDRHYLQMAYMHIDHANLLRHLAGRKQFVSGGNLEEDEIQRIAAGDKCEWPHLEHFNEVLRSSNASRSMPEIERLLFYQWAQYVFMTRDDLFSTWLNWHIQFKLLVLRDHPSDEALESAADTALLKDLVTQYQLTEWVPLPESLIHISKQANIYQREWEIDDWKWDQLETTADREPFSIEALMAYSLKQEIAFRRSALLSPKADNLLHTIVEDVLNTYV